MNDLQALNDSELRTRLDQSIACEQRAMFEVVRVLAEFEERRAYLALGYRSSYEYPTKHLKYSEAAATRRIRAAQAARALPEVIEQIESGAVSFSAIETCSELLVETGGKVVLEALKGKTIEEARSLKFSSRPNAGRVSRDTVTPIMSFSPVAQSEIDFEKTAELSCNRSDGSASSNRGAEVLERKSDDEVKHRISFTAGKAFMRKLERVKELKFRGVREDLSLEELLGEALEYWLEKKAPERRIARRDQRASSQSRASKSPKQPEIKRSNVNPRSIPIATRDQVLKRDEYRCSFISADGRRCSGREDLEIDHRRPVAFGGGSELENLRTLCRAHNSHAWEVARAEVFGR